LKANNSGKLSPNTCKKKSKNYPLFNVYLLVGWAMPTLLFYD
jgi:hypothetical protein